MAPAVKYWVMIWNTVELPMVADMPAFMLPGNPLKP